MQGGKQDKQDRKSGKMGRINVLSCPSCRFCDLAYPVFLYALYCLRDCFICRYELEWGTFMDREFSIGVLPRRLLGLFVF
jgi:hypothetical protein